MKISQEVLGGYFLDSHCIFCMSLCCPVTLTLNLRQLTCHERYFAKSPTPNITTTEWQSQYKSVYNRNQWFADHMCMNFVTRQLLKSHISQQMFALQLTHKSSKNLKWQFITMTLKYVDRWCLLKPDIFARNNYSNIRPNLWLDVSIRHLCNLSR